MKTIIIFQFLFVILLGCYKENDPENKNPQTSPFKLSLLQPFIDDTTITNINGTWKVLSYEDYINDSVTLKNDVSLTLIGFNGDTIVTFHDRDVIITFQNNSIYGKNTYNVVQGNYFLQKRKIKVISMYSTKIGQPMWGDMFNNVILKLDSYAINNVRLRFYYNNSKNSLTLDKYNP